MSKKETRMKQTMDLAEQMKNNIQQAALQYATAEFKRYVQALNVDDPRKKLGQLYIIAEVGMKQNQLIKEMLASGDVEFVNGEFFDEAKMITGDFEEAWKGLKPVQDHTSVEKEGA